MKDSLKNSFKRSRNIGIAAVLLALALVLVLPVLHRKGNLAETPQETRQETSQEETSQETPQETWAEPEAPETQKMETEAAKDDKEEIAAEEVGRYDSTMPVKDLPKRYDFREEGRISRIKNQGNIGTCWAFASCMALETRLLPGLETAFSEDHMSMHNSFGLSQNEGGEYTMAMAYLLSWQGPVSEADDTYGDGVSPDGLEPTVHVQEINILPADDIDAIKNAVYSYGGVQSSLYTAMAAGQVDNTSYNKETGAYYYSGIDSANHDVVIIGWDDDYDPENFIQYPPGKGAFICANSWGYELDRKSVV